MGVVLVVDVWEALDLDLKVGVTAFPSAGSSFRSGVVQKRTPTRPCQSKHRRSPSVTASPALQSYKRPPMEWPQQGLRLRSTGGMSSNQRLWGVSGFSRWGRLRRR